MKEKAKKKRKAQPSNGGSDPHRDAKALKSDKEIWVKVDGGRKTTFSSVIKVNSGPGVTPITHFDATRIRKLKVGESYEDHGAATIERVAKPMKRKTTAKKAASPTKPKARKKGLSGAKSRPKPKAAKPAPRLFHITRAKWKS